MAIYTIKRGNPEPFEIEIKYFGDPVDITGQAVRAMIKRKISDKDEDALWDKAVTSHTDAVNGLTLLQMTSAESLLIPPGVHYFACKRYADSLMTEIVIEYETTEIEFENQLIKS